MIMIDKKKLELALEALERNVQHKYPLEFTKAIRLGEESINALRTALEQEEIDWSLLEATQSSLREHMAEIRRLRAALEQVPVGWNSVGATSLEFETECSDGTRFLNVAEMPNHAVRWRVVTPPRREWVSLTDAEIDALLLTTSGSVIPFYRAMSRAVEVALKAKNHG